MTLFELVRFVLEIAAVVLCCYGIYREKDLVRFERKVWIYTKAFVKSVVFSLRDKFSSPKPIVEIKSVVDEDYEEKLRFINRASNVIDIQIAS